MKPARIIVLSKCMVALGCSFIFASIVGAQEEAFSYGDFDDFNAIYDSSDGSASHPDPDLTFDSSDFIGAWITGRPEFGSGSGITWAVRGITGPTGSTEDVAQYVKVPLDAPGQKAGLMQFVPAHQLVGNKKLQFFLLLNIGGGGGGGGGNAGFHVEVFAFKSFWNSGYFALSRQVPGADDDGGGNSKFDLSGGDTVPAILYDKLLDTYAFTKTNDAQITASTWQAISLDLDFGPANEFDPELGQYDGLAIRFTARTAFDEDMIAIDKVNINDGSAPFDIALSSTSIDENESIGTLVGTLTALDADSGDTFSYSLVAGAGDTDNALFSISGDQLLSATVFDYESQTSASIRIQVEDSAGLIREEAFTLSITDLEDVPPTDIVLSVSEFLENVPIGTAVADMSAVDPDSVGSFFYNLVSGVGDTDNALFGVSGNSLITAALFDFETQSSVSIRLRVLDGAGLEFQKAFVLTILEDIEDPVVQVANAFAAAGLTDDDAEIDAIPFNDGVENLLKYAFNMNLSGADSSTMQTDGNSGVPGGNLVEVEGQTYWRVQYVVRRSSGLIYSPVRTNNLTQAFVPLSGTPVIDEIDDEWFRYTVDEPCDSETASQCFSKVQVTLPAE